MTENARSSTDVDLDTVAPAIVTRSEREHGRAKYVVEKCRCDVCRKACRDYERWRSKQRAYGRVAYVDAEPVRVHVRALQAQGMGWKRIARAAGISESVMWKLIYGCPQRHMAPSKRVRPATAAAIFAVVCDLDSLGATVCVDSTGTRRRLQALVTLGWSQSKLATRLGMTPGNFCRTIKSPMVQAGTARAVRALYDELWKVAPPEDTHRDRIAASRARNYATTRDWKPPLWWDEDHIDLPVIPDQPELLGDFDFIAIERAMTGEPVRLTHDERDEAVRRLLDQGHNRSEIARRLHLNGQTINALLARIAEEAA